MGDVEFFFHGPNEKPQTHSAQSSFGENEKIFNHGEKSERPGRPRHAATRPYKVKLKQLTLFTPAVPAPPAGFHLIQTPKSVKKPRRPHIVFTSS